jgi:hypothetical protein
VARELAEVGLIAGKLGAADALLTMVVVSIDEYRSGCQLGL